MQTDIESSIIAIVDNFLPKGTKNKVLLISIDARVSFYPGEKRFFKEECQVVKGVHFAIFAPSNYIKVVMAVEDGFTFSFNPNLNFNFKSDHDSCWRDDGIKSPLFGVVCKMIDELVKQGAPSLPFNQYSWFTRISSMKIVDGKINVDRNNDYKVTLNIEGD